MYAAGQAGVEAADGAHDVYALEVVISVLLEDGRVLHSVFVVTERAVDVARAGSNSDTSWGSYISRNE